MDPPSKRKRSENWDSSDKILLRKLIEENIEIIEDKSVDTNTSKAKRDAWKKILSSFNKCSNSLRDVAQIQCQWRNTKMAVKKKNSNYRRERGATGGGPPPKSPDPMDDRLMGLIPNEFAVDHNTFDSDATIPQDKIMIEENKNDQIEFLMEKLVNNDPCVPPDAPAINGNDNESQRKKSNKSKHKYKNAQDSMCDENLKAIYLEVAIEAKNAEVEQSKKKYEEDIENLRLERSLKIKAYEADEKRKEDEHFLKIKAYNAEEKRKEEEHNLRMQNLKHEHDLKNERTKQMRF